MSRDKIKEVLLDSRTVDFWGGNVIRANDDDIDILIDKIHEASIEKPEIKQVISFSVVSRYDEMVFKPPFRVGRKQGKAVLDSNGLLVTFFQESESQALLFCDYLNHKF
jgi:hypothetical protein